MRMDVHVLMTPSLHIRCTHVHMRRVRLREPERLVCGHVDGSVGCVDRGEGENENHYNVTRDKHFDFWAPGHDRRQGYDRLCVIEHNRSYS